MVRKGMEVRVDCAAVVEGGTEVLLGVGPLEAFASGSLSGGPLSFLFLSMFNCSMKYENKQ